MPRKGANDADAAESFGATLRALRHRQGWSQEELADESGLHRTEISLLERAGRDVRLSTMVRLARALDRTVADLVKGI